MFMLLRLLDPSFSCGHGLFMLASCRAASGDTVFSLLHAGASHFSLNRQLPILSPCPCGLPGIETRVSVSLSSTGEVMLSSWMMKGTRSTWCPALSPRATQEGGPRCPMEAAHPSPVVCFLVEGGPARPGEGRCFCRPFPSQDALWVWLKTPMTFRHAFLVPTRFLKDI